MLPSDDARTTSPAAGDAECICAGNVTHHSPHCRKSLFSDQSSSSSTNSDRITRIVYASAKGFRVGVGFKGVLSLFSLLARQRSAKSPKGAVVLREIKETLRYGLFLGTFAGTFTSMDEIIAAFGGHCRTAKWRALLAGAVAGPSILITGLNTQQNSLAIYILMRAAVLASQCGIKSKRFRPFCKPLTWSYGDIFLMCLSSSQILCAYILKQDSLPSSYKSFLNKHGGKDMAILQGVKDIASGIPFSNLETIEKSYRSTGVNITLDPGMKIPCKAYTRALPVYLPVYLVPALISHRQDMLRRPWMIMGKSGYGIARSSLFLSIYSASAWMWTCLVFRISRRCSIPLLAMGAVGNFASLTFSCNLKEEKTGKPGNRETGKPEKKKNVLNVIRNGIHIVQFGAGLSIAIEKKSRRTKISLYCLGRAIETFFTCMADIGYLPQSLMNIKRPDVIAFSLSTSIIMHCYSQEREVFRTNFLNVLDWVFGAPPAHCYTPRYKHDCEEEYI